MLQRAFLYLVVTIAPAHAEIINLSFHSDGDSVYALEDNPSGKVVTAGAGGARYWNNIINHGGVGLRFNKHVLLNGDGKGSGVRLSVRSGYAGFTAVPTEGVTDDHVLYKGWYGFRADEFLKLENIPARFVKGGYTLVIYADVDGDGRKMDYHLKNQTGVITDGPVFAGEVLEGQNMLTVTGLHEETLEIKGNKDATGLRSCISGLQIITDNHNVFFSNKEEAAPDGKVWLRWECGGDVRSVQVQGPQGGVLHKSSSAMGQLQVNKDKVEGCKIVVERAGGKVTIPVSMK